jgi:hypothetical protein
VIVLRPDCNGPLPVITLRYMVFTQPCSVRGF